ncbi:MAG: sulfatase-like hydrolase/transferase [Pirellulaceae bacterium]
MPRGVTPEEVSVPEFLPDLPAVRKEIAQYYSSVFRADVTVGEVLRALEESGHREDTIVMLLSDHGMAFPFVKTNCYLQSTRTPWMVRWPGRIEPNSHDQRHMISGIDLAPTLLDLLDLPPLPAADGRSFKPLLQGDEQEGATACSLASTARRRARTIRCGV